MSICEALYFAVDCINCAILDFRTHPKTAGPNSKGHI